MELKDIEIDHETMKLEIDIMDVPSSCVIVISEGKAKMRELPAHGEYKIITHKGKVSRMRIEQGEDF